MSIFIEKVLKVSEMLRLQLLLFLSCSEKINREGRGAEKIGVNLPNGAVKVVIDSCCFSSFDQSC